MKEIKKIREQLNISQKEVANHLKVNLRTYQRWEKTDCNKKVEILKFLKDYEHKDKFLGLGVVRLAELLNVNVGNLSVYMRSGKEIKGLDKVLADRRSELMGLKVECMRLLVECLEEC